MMASYQGECVASLRGIGGGINGVASRPRMLALDDLRQSFIIRLNLLQHLHMFSWLIRICK